MSVRKWVNSKMQAIALQYDDSVRLTYLCTFQNVPGWMCDKTALRVAGVKFTFAVRKDWVCQSVKTGVSLGYFDFSRKSVVVPSQQWYATGPFDNEAWEETDAQWDTSELLPNTFRTKLTLFSTNLEDDSSQIPELDKLISDVRVDVEPNVDEPRPLPEAGA